MIRLRIGNLGLGVGVVLACAFSVNPQSAIRTPQSKKAIPEFVHGEECLFCHRGDIGLTWQQNNHGLTLLQREFRPAIEQRLSPPKEVQFFLGARSHFRLLKQAGYGKLAIWDERSKAWDQQHFQARCAGCHTTAYDSDAATYAYLGLDCYTCHGALPQEHANDPATAFLSKRKAQDPQQVTAACAQCHLRGGKSKTTGLPFPYNYTAPDKLFDDFQVNLALSDDKTLNPGDRHVYRNVRDVILKGVTSVTCLTCHTIHKQSTNGHWRAYKTTTNAPICFDCHATNGKYTPGYVVHSALCEY